MFCLVLANAPCVCSFRFYVTPTRRPKSLHLTLLSRVAGSFVVVDETGKVKALESGSKVACLVSQVLFYEQVRELQKTPEWCATVSSFNFCIYLLWVPLLINHIFTFHIKFWILYGRI